MNNTITNLQLSQFIVQNENEVEPEFQRILYDILVSCSKNMSVNPYVERSHLEEYKDLDIDQCLSPVESNERFYQKFLATPKKKLMKNNSINSLSTKSSTSNSVGRNSLNHNSFNQIHTTTSGGSGNAYLIPPQQQSDNHSNSSMDNNIDLSVDDEQLKVKKFFFFIFLRN